MSEIFDEVPREEPGAWDKAIAEAQRQFALQESMDSLENPSTTETQKKEIYRKLGAVLLVISLPVLAIVAAKRISEILKRKRKADLR